MRSGESYHRPKEPTNLPPVLQRRPRRRTHGVHKPRANAAIDTRRAHATSSSSPTPTPDGAHPFFHLLTHPSQDTFSASYPALARQMSTPQRTQGYVPSASAGLTFVPDPTAGVGARGCYVLTPPGRAGLLRGESSPRGGSQGARAGLDASLHLGDEGSLRHTHILSETTLLRSLGIASANTAWNFETGTSRHTKSRYLVKMLLIPKQHAASDARALDEEGGFTEARGLITLGWDADTGHVHMREAAIEIVDLR
ncbi:hypothetical protein DFH09DRAFT_1446444 [Mycena vulgaris]|nr:hypothetical protein DFH09DRAFT_1446444 [Mycena vulgaris]